MSGQSQLPRAEAARRRYFKKMMDDGELREKQHCIFQQLKFVLIGYLFLFLHAFVN